MIVWYCGKENSIRWHCHNDPEFRKNGIGFQKQAEMPSFTYMNHSGNIQKAPVCMHIYVTKVLESPKSCQVPWSSFDMVCRYTYTIFLNEALSIVFPIWHILWFLSILGGESVCKSHSVFDCACEVFVEVFDCICICELFVFLSIKNHCLIVTLSDCFINLLSTVSGKVCCDCAAILLHVI